MRVLLLALLVAWCWAQPPPESCDALGARVASGERRAGLGPDWRWAGGAAGGLLRTTPALHLAPALHLGSSLLCREDLRTIYGKCLALKLTFSFNVAMQERRRRRRRRAQQQAAAGRARRWKKRSGSQTSTCPPASTPIPSAASTPWKPLLTWVWVSELCWVGAGAGGQEMRAVPAALLLCAMCQSVYTHALHACSVGQCRSITVCSRLPCIVQATLRCC